VQPRAFDGENEPGAPATRVAEDASDLDWLARMGVVALDEHGAWTLTDLGRGAMARFYESATPPAISANL
jgi:hypothetical protein